MLQKKNLERLNDILESKKKTLSEIQSSKKLNKDVKGLISNPFITTREVEEDLISSIYNINSIINNLIIKT